MRHAKENKNMTHTWKKTKGAKENVPEGELMVNLVAKEFKPTIINMLK